MCISSLQSCTVDFSSPYTLYFDIEILPEGGSQVELGSFSFQAVAPEIFVFSGGSTGINNYPTRWAYVVTVNGVIQMVESDLSTSQIWSEQVIDLTGIVLNEQSNLSIQLLPYCTVGVDSPISAWDLENIELHATCSANTTIDIQGSIVNRVGLPMQDVEVNLHSQGAHETQITDANGNYSRDNFEAEYCTIQPYSDEHPRNGVSTLDLIIIQRHLLNIQSFLNDYDFIAADANKSQSVTVADIAELRKLILGYQDGLSNNASWRFDLINEINLTPYNIQESANALPSTQHSTDFIAIKIGDLNSSALVEVNDDKTTNVRGLETFPMLMKQDNAYLELYADAPMDITGLQLALDITNAGVIDLDSPLFDIQDENYRIEGSHVRFSWNTQEVMSIEKGDLLLQIELEITQHDDLISVEFNNAIEAEVYSADLETLHIGLTSEYNFVKEAQTISVYPIPAFEQITIVIDDFAQELTFDIYKLDGQYVSSGICQSATTIVDLENMDNGVYMLVINDNNGIPSRTKFVKIDN